METNTQQPLPLSEAAAPPIDVHAANVIVVASVSGGKDSGAASLYLKRLGIPHRRAFANTKWEHPKLYEYLRGPLTDVLGAIDEVAGPLGFEELVRKKGLFPSRVMRFCTQQLKVFPLRDYVRRVAEENPLAEIVNVVGIRADESNARSKMTEWEFSEDFDCWIWRPLIAWSTADVIAEHARAGLPMNPLYGMGAKRVGCWPCIHENKKGLVVVAENDPARIDLIESMEADLNAEGAARDKAKGRDWIPRSMFSYHGGDNKHIPLTIRETIEWARSARGEFQPPGAGDGCARFGLCSVAEEEKES